MVEHYIHYTSMENLYRILITNKLLLSFKGDYGAGLYLTNNSPFATNTHLFMHMYDIKKNKKMTNEELKEIKIKKDRRVKDLEFFLIIETQDGKVEPARSVVNNVARKSQFVLQKEDVSQIKILKIGQRITNDKGKVKKIIYWTKESINHLVKILEDYQCSIKLDLTTVDVDYTKFLTLDHKYDTNERKKYEYCKFTKDNVLRQLKEIEKREFRRPSIKDE